MDNIEDSGAAYSEGYAAGLAAGADRERWQANAFCSRLEHLRDVVRRVLPRLGEDEAVVLGSALRETARPAIDGPVGPTILGEAVARAEAAEAALAALRVARDRCAADVGHAPDCCLCGAMGET